MRIEDEESEPEELTTAAEERALLLRAARVYEGKLINGEDDAEETLEAEAGAILMAETAQEIHELREMAERWFEAQS